MLTAPQPDRHRQQRPQSLRREYEEFIERRIEEYKDQLSRGALLDLADEAVRELEVGPDAQLVLTEVLMLDHVDRLIRKRLKLPTFKRWRERHLRLRDAQRAPTHWGLDMDTPLIDFALRLEPGDLTVVIGAGAVGAGLYIAAHGHDVLLIEQDLSQVEAAERYAASEDLGGVFQGLVVNLGGWFPDVIPSLVLMHAGLLSRLDASLRRNLVEALQESTVSGGVHAVMPAPAGGDVISITPDSLQAQYSRWISDRAAASARRRWLTARKP